MRLIIVGTGSMARHHAQHFSKIRGVKIVGCVDIFPELAEHFFDVDDDIEMLFASQGGDFLAGHCGGWCRMCNRYRSSERVRALPSIP